MRAAGSIEASRANKRTHVMDLGITGKTALVLGAGGGLGGAIAKALAREGARVAVGESIRKRWSAPSTRSAAMAERPCRSHGTWRICRCIDDRVRTIEEQLGPVDILVNNTGGPPPTPAAGQDPELWSRSFQSMVLSVIALTDRVLPGMRAAQMGPHHHQHLVGRRRADPQSRHLERAAALAGRLVEDAGAGGRRRRHHRQHRPARPHRDAAHHLPRRAEGQARRPRRRGGRGRERRLDPGRPLRRARGIWRCRRLPGQRARGLHHRQRHPRRWRPDREHLSSGNRTERIYP